MTALALFAATYFLVLFLGLQSLHMWRPVRVDFPQPDSLMVGTKVEVAA